MSIEMDVTSHWTPVTTVGEASQLLHAAATVKIYQAAGPLGAHFIFQVSSESTYSEVDGKKVLSCVVASSGLSGGEQSRIYRIWNKGEKWDVPSEATLVVEELWKNGGLGISLREGGKKDTFPRCHQLWVAASVQC